MKITCPKCQACYKVDLPDPGEAGIDVQCGKCLYIFLFRSDTEKLDSSQIQKDASVKIQESDLPEDRPSEPILPPQKDEDQAVSSSQEQAPPTETGPESAEELELEPISEDAEPVEIVVEDDTPEESLEEVALDDIWNQAVQEGARTVAKSKGKPPTPSADTDATGEETTEEASTAPAEKPKPLPSLEDRQKEIDQLIADHQTQQKELSESTPTENPEPSPAQQDTDKTQEEIDLEERVVIDEGEAMPNWEEAFIHQSKVEEGWKKAQEQDRILEEQQLADALGKKDLPDESAPEETAATAPQEDKQSLVDEIFSETKNSQKSSEENAETPQPDAEIQKVNEPEEIVVDEEEVMPSWEEAFADQSEVETSWGKAQEEDRIHEEQQLADALGEEYDPSEAPAEETPVTAKNEQDRVDQLFQEVKSQRAAGEQVEAQAQSESPEASDDKAASSETLATSVGGHTIPGEIDLMTDLDDLNMKQLVTQAFKEESESQEKSGHPETATNDEVAGEPELTMESMAETLQAEEPPSDEPSPEAEVIEEPELTMESMTETLQAEEPPSVDPSPEAEVIEEPELTMESMAEALQAEESSSDEPIPELEMESASELTLETDEEETEPVEVIAQEEEVELESIPELILESAEDELKDETTADLETRLESAETPEEVEALIAELSPEVDSEPELTMESKEDTEVPATDSVMSPESLLADNEKDDQIWDDLLPENNEEEELAEVEIEAETPVAISEEKDEDPFEENDFWDQVLEKDSQDSQTTETERQPVSSSPVSQDTSGRETLTDEELWKQAFPGEDEFETTTAQPSDEAEEDTQPEPAPLVIGANVAPSEDSEDSLKYDDAAYADYDDDDDEFEFERRKRKLGPFVIPHGRRGDLVITGVMVVFLLLAGSIYFTLQTFAPGELTDIQTAENDVPEGLTPREVPLDELAGDLISPKPEKPVDTPGDKGEATLSDPSKILEASPEEKGILKDLAESQILKDTGKSQTAKIDQSALQALTGRSVTMSTIMPVAYNPTDIRVLSFSVEIQLSNARSAKRVRESMPVYEEIINQTVEDFLRRKFYTDILYVKEKLQKRLQTAMNQSLKNGRVKKAKFTDFAIQ